MHVLGEIHHDGDVAALPGQAGAAAARENRRAVASRRGHRRHDVVDRPRDDDADRHLPVVGTVGGVECPAAGVEADLGRRGSPQVGLQGAGRFGSDGGAAVVLPQALETGLLVGFAKDRQADRHAILRDGASAYAAVCSPPQTLNRSASARLNSRPRPGRDESGRSEPFSGSIAPSKSMASMRA